MASTAALIHRAIVHGRRDNKSVPSPVATTRLAARTADASAHRWLATAPAVVDGDAHGPTAPSATGAGPQETPLPPCN